MQDLTYDGCFYFEWSNVYSVTFNELRRPAFRVCHCFLSVQLNR